MLGITERASLIRVPGARGQDSGDYFSLPAQATGADGTPHGVSGISMGRLMCSVCEWTI